MKKTLATAIFTLQFCMAIQVFAINSDSIAISKTYYNQAKDKLVEMLDGKKTLSYERAIYLIENAYWDNGIDSGKFKSAIDYDIDIIRGIATSSRAKPKKAPTEDLWQQLQAYRAGELGYFDKTKLNWAIYSFMTDTTYNIRQNGMKIVVDNTPFRYSSDDPLGTIDWYNTQVTHLLVEKRGNCFALASLFKIFSERLNSEADICTAPGHIYITHKDDRGTYYNIEVTSKSFPGTGTMETLTYTTDDAIKNDISLRQLNQKQSVALCLVYLAKGYEYKLKVRGDNFALQCADLALKYDPLNLNAMLLKAEVLETSVLNKNKTIAQLQSDESFKEYQKLISHLYALGYREMPLEMKNILLNHWMHDRSTVIVTTNHTDKVFNKIDTGYNRYASLSWGVFDEEIRSKSVEKYSHTLFDTKKKVITKFVKEDILYNDYSFDPVIFALNVDPLAHKLPGWSPYSAFVDNPIINFDKDGAFPYTFHIRAFAPTGAFKNFPVAKFDDDKRGFSTNTDVTSRIRQSFTVDPTAHTFSGGAPKSDPTVMHVLGGTHSRTATDEGGVSKPEFSTGSVGGANASFTTHFGGSNPFFDGAAPDIKVSSAISITENLKNNSLNISIDLSSKQFPASEAFIQDVTGKAVFLGGAAANGGVSDLITRGEKNVMSVDLTIGLNNKGEFQNVTTGGKTYSIDDFNKMGTSKPATDDKK